jgi:dTDP-4-dehydrorhamnose reductase
MQKSNSKKILFTGGSGLLGSEFKKLVKDALYPTHREFDVTDYWIMEKYLKEKKVSTIIHAAAFISPPKVDKDPMRALETNLVGTANVVKLCMKNDLKLVYINSDYVFRGDKGKYKEEDPVFPVNKYGWSKLGGECAVRMYDNNLIIRTTFGPNIFPYPTAFVDQWTSREKVAVVADLIMKLVKKGAVGVYHVGGKRKTVYAYSKGVSPEKNIKKISIKDMAFELPVDTSLDVSKQNKFLRIK